MSRSKYEASWIMCQPKEKHNNANDNRGNAMSHYVSPAANNFSPQSQNDDSLLLIQQYNQRISAGDFGCGCVSVTRTNNTNTRAATRFPVIITSYSYSLAFPYTNDCLNVFLSVSVLSFILPSFFFVCAIVALCCSGVSFIHAARVSFIYTTNHLSYIVAKYSYRSTTTTLKSRMKEEQQQK